jgi:hypothetical protein
MIKPAGAQVFGGGSSVCDQQGDDLDPSSLASLRPCPGCFVISFFPLILNDIARTFLDLAPAFPRWNICSRQSRTRREMDTRPGPTRRCHRLPYAGSGRHRPTERTRNPNPSHCPGPARNQGAPPQAARASINQPQQAAAGTLTPVLCHMSLQTCEPLQHGSGQGFRAARAIVPGTWRPPRWRRASAAGHTRV